MTNDTLSRRRFLKISAASAIAVPLVAGTLPVRAQEVVALAEDDPTAQALGYKDDATKVDTARFANYKAGQDCGNCVQYKAEDGAANGACAIFPGKTVARAGWCQVWVKGA